MQSPQDALVRTAVIILDKVVWDARGGKTIGMEGFHKKTSIVPKNFRFDQDDIRNLSALKIHCPIILDGHFKEKFQME